MIDYSGTNRSKDDDLKCAKAVRKAHSVWWGIETPGPILLHTNVRELMSQWKGCRFWHEDVADPPYALEAQDGLVGVQNIRPINAHATDDLESSDTAVTQLARPERRPRPDSVSSTTSDSFQTSVDPRQTGAYTPPASFLPYSSTVAKTMHQDPKMEHDDYKQLSDPVETEPATYHPLNSAITPTNEGNLNVEALEPSFSRDQVSHITLPLSLGAAGQDSLSPLTTMLPNEIKAVLIPQNTVVSAFSGGSGNRPDSGNVPNKNVPSDGILVSVNGQTLTPGGPAITVAHALNNSPSLMLSLDPSNKLIYNPVTQTLDNASADPGDGNVAAPDTTSISEPDIDSGIMTGTSPSNRLIYDPAAQASGNAAATSAPSDAANPDAAHGAAPDTIPISEADNGSRIKIGTSPSNQPIYDPVPQTLDSASTATFVPTAATNPGAGDGSAPDPTSISEADKGCRIIHGTNSTNVMVFTGSASFVLEEQALRQYITSVVIISFLFISMY